MSVIKSKNAILTYILWLLLIFYTLKGALYPTGIISMIIAAMELGICLLLGLKSFKFKRRCNAVNILLFIIALMIVSFISSNKIVHGSIIGKVSTFTFFREFCGALFPALAMYYLSRNNQVPIKYLNIFFYLLFCSTIIAFFHQTVTQMINTNKEDITINASYRFVYIMPFVVLIKEHYKVFVLWLVAFSFCILSAKRGAILCIGVECIVYYWWQYRKSHHKYLFIICFIAIICILCFYLNQYYLNDMYFQMRVESTMEGKTSGRDILISKLLNAYYDFGLIQMIFGSGCANTVNIAGNYAHNDWVEILIDCGLLGLCLYASFYLSFVYIIKHTNITQKHFLGLIFISFLLPSFFSMVFFSEGSSIGFAWLGLILGVIDKNKYYKRKHLSDSNIPI